MQDSAGNPLILLPPVSLCGQLYIWHAYYWSKGGDDYNSSDIA